MAEQKMDLKEFVKTWEETKAIPVSFNQRDLITYAVGIGSTDLRYVYENDGDFAMFPTYSFVLAFKGTDQDVVGFPSDAMMAQNIVPPLDGVRAGLDGERYLEVIKPLPADGGQFYLKRRMVGCLQKGKGAACHDETIITDEEGEIYIKMTGATFLLGAKNFIPIGKSTSETAKPPKREPDAVSEMPTSPYQAQLYRLSGDYNPLHVDPMAASMMGFPKPILHGLCSLGVSARAVLAKYGANDPDNFKSIRVRFSKPVLPGETLVVKQWVCDINPSKILFEVFVKERNVKVISNACMVLKKVVMPSKM